MQKAFVITLALALSGCATTQPPPVHIQVVEKKVPVPVPCISADTPPEPSYPDTDEAIAKADAAQVVGLLGAGRKLRIQRAAEIEPKIELCRRSPIPLH